jgi:phage tail-like protein
VGQPRFAHDAWTQSSWKKRAAALEGAAALLRLREFFFICFTCRCMLPRMAEFTVNTQRYDPYKNFKFRVKWDGQYIPAVSRITGLVRTTEVIHHREGGDPSTSHKSPGRTEYDAITLERGLTDDESFEQWANQVWQLGAALGSEVALNEFRKDVIIEFYNEAGQLVRAYKVYRCWPSQYQALPSLDANGAAVAIEHIKLENEGWERDASVVPPAQP